MTKNIVYRWLFLFVFICVATLQANEKIDIVVIDMDSEKVRAGFAGEDDPRITFDNVVGYSQDEKDVYVGDEATSKSSVLSLVYPLDNQEMDMDACKEIFHYIFAELNVEPNETIVLLTYGFSMSQSQKEEIAQFILEELEVPGFSMRSRENLALYASGRTMGVVLQCDSSETLIVPISEGHILSDHVKTLGFGKNDMVQYLEEILGEREYFFSSMKKKGAVKDILEKLCYVTHDFEEQMNASEESSEQQQLYTLPDGQDITVATERFRAPEIFFQPDLIELDINGIHQEIVDVIAECDEDIQEQLYSNIVLSGSNSMYDGLSDRLQSEILELISDDIRIKIIAEPDRGILSWRGGSILASLTTFEKMWVTKEKYEEEGIEVFDN